MALCIHATGKLEIELGLYSCVYTERESGKRGLGLALDLFVLSENYMRNTCMGSAELGLTKDRWKDRPNLYIENQFYKKNSKIFSLIKNENRYRPKRRLIT